MIICATGYDMRFPFFDESEIELHPDSDHRYPLFKRMIKPGEDHLFFMGLAQSSPTIVNLAEQQSKLLAKLLDRELRAARRRGAGADHGRRRGAHLEQYYAAQRHTIQIDFGRYCVDLQRGDRGRGGASAGDYAPREGERAEVADRGAGAGAPSPRTSGRRARCGCRRRSRRPTTSGPCTIANR